ncbi:hypothetical protein J4470_01115, partial [Candidatus Woesearchaeota archaeon]|nr:hypothetical protein [Candidatus Woesearchaeota archaeon]
EDFQATELRDFYAYANNKMRLTGESYVEFLTGGSSPGITEDKSITLEPGQQWSTIFMLKELENSAFLPLFRNNLPKINSGIVNCFMVAEDDDGNLVQAKYGGASIGCENGIDGFVFGKVAAGYDKNTILGLGYPRAWRDGCKVPYDCSFHSY